MKSTNAPNLASGLLVLLIGLLIFNIHLLIAKLLVGQDLKFSDVVIPCFILFASLYVINDLLLVSNLKYLKIEDFFIQKKHPKYFEKLFVAVGVLIGALLVVIPLLLGA